MNNENNFEIKQTVRIYETALMTDIETQYKKVKDKFKYKNDYFVYLIELGLKAIRQEIRADSKKKPSAEPEENDIYSLLLEIFKYTSTQFKKMYIDQNILQRLFCAMYNMLIALNNDERLITDKIEDGFFDDLPPRFEKVINELQKRYGLN